MVGTEIRRRRRERRLTQEQLAFRAGLTPHYLSTIENGHRDPSLSTIEALAGALETTPGELLGARVDVTPAALELAKRIQKLPENAQAVLTDLVGVLERGR
jgi:transcriptional regulator with XRE-family HTH domain